MVLKKILKPYIDPRILGFVDYLRSDEADRNWGGELNGQECRKTLLGELLAVCNFNYIVETGTFRGVTTEYFSTVHRRTIHSIEADARNFGYAKARLWRLKNVYQYFGDSRGRLLMLFEAKILSGSGFYYLDAHWGDDLPLAEEVSLIAKYDPEAVVLVDDFQVPDDAGYEYDDHCSGNKLNLDYLMPVIEAASLSVFFPASSSEEETGAKRGSVVLGASQRAASLQSIRSIRQWLP
jgi:hypothetical protein